MNLANGLSILFIFLRNQLLVLLIIVIVFISFSVISALIFTMSFLLLTLRGFALLCLVALRLKLGFLFDVSFVS